MQTFFPSAVSPVHALLIALHVASALGALALGPLAMSTRKGGAAHARMGMAYVATMVAANLSALALLAWRFNPFLLGVTLLALYSVLTGYRITRTRRALAAGRTPRADLLLGRAAIAGGALLALWGALTLAGLVAQAIPSGGPRIMAGLLPLIFGVLVLNGGRTDLSLLRRPTRPPLWWRYHHMERMLGSYTALVTALMVQEVGERLPANLAWIVWVAPAIIGGIATARWIAYDRVQRAPAAAHAPAGD